MHMQRTMISALIVVLTVPGMALAAGKARIIAAVVDAAGEPVSGVKVTVTSPDIPDFRGEDTTDAQGIFNVKLTGCDASYHCELEKQGYRAIRPELKCEGEGIQRFELTVHREGSAPTADDANLEDSIIRTACFRARTARELNGIHNQYVHVECRGDEHYLLTMKRPCDSLEGAMNIAIGASSDRICSNSRADVIFHDSNNIPHGCAIRRVEQVPDGWEARALMKSRTEQPTTQQPGALPTP